MQANFNYLCEYELDLFDSGIASGVLVVNFQLRKTRNGGAIDRTSVSSGKDF